ncbi:hypothetical protein LTS08_003230 [Lithohypha guttulata]|nr:hypothetical protein LTS08_003230 [Lithohypha guttulata]
MSSSESGMQRLSVAPGFVYIFNIGDYTHLLYPVDQKASENLTLAQKASVDIDRARNLLTERGPFLLSDNQQKMDDLITDTEEAINRVIKLLTPARVEQVSEESIRINPKSAWALQSDEPKIAATFARLYSTHGKLRTVVHDLKNIEATAQLDNCEIRAATAISSASLDHSQPGQAEDTDVSSQDQRRSASWRRSRQLSKQTATSDAFTISKPSADEQEAPDLQSPVSSDSNTFLHSSHPLSLPEPRSINNIISSSHGRDESLDIPTERLPVIHELESIALQSDTLVVDDDMQEDTSPVTDTGGSSTVAPENVKMGSFASYRKRNRQSRQEPQAQRTLVATGHEVLYQRPEKLRLLVENSTQAAAAMPEDMMHPQMPQQHAQTSATSLPPHNNQVLSVSRFQLSPQTQTPSPAINTTDENLKRRLSSATRTVEVYAIDPVLTKLPSLLRAGRNGKSKGPPPYPVSNPGSEDEGEESRLEINAPQTREFPPERSLTAPPVQQHAPTNHLVPTMPLVPDLTQHQRSLSDTSVPQINVIRAPTIPRKPLPYRNGFTSMDAGQMPSKTPEQSKESSQPFSSQHPISQLGTSGPPSPLGSLHQRKSSQALHSLSVQGPPSPNSSRQSSVSIEAEPSATFVEASSKVAGDGPDLPGQSQSKLVEIPLETANPASARQRSRPMLNPLSMHPVRRSKPEDEPPPAADEQQLASPTVVNKQQSAYQVQSAVVNVTKQTPQTIPIADYRSPAYQQSRVFSDPAFNPAIRAFQTPSPSRFRDQDQARPQITNRSLTAPDPLSPKDAASVSLASGRRMSEQGQLPYPRLAGASLDHRDKKTRVVDVDGQPTESYHTSKPHILAPQNSAVQSASQPISGPRIFARTEPPSVVGHNRNRSFAQKMSELENIASYGPGQPRREAKELFGRHIWNPDVSGLAHQHYSQHQQDTTAKQASWSQQQRQPPVHPSYLSHQHFHNPNGHHWSATLDLNSQQKQHDPHLQPLPEASNQELSQQHYPLRAQQRFPFLQTHISGQGQSAEVQVGSRRLAEFSLPRKPTPQHERVCGDEPQSVLRDQSRLNQLQDLNTQHTQEIRTVLHGRAHSTPQAQTQTQPRPSLQSAHSQPQLKGRIQPQPQNQRPQSYQQSSTSAVLLMPVMENQVLPQQPQSFSNTYKSIDISDGKGAAAPERPTVKTSKPKTRKRSSWLSHQASRLTLGKGS